MTHQAGRQRSAPGYHRTPMSEERQAPPARPARAPQAGGEPSWTPQRVLFLTPRWARDGGVGAHVVASAAALAQAGVEVTVLVTRIDSDERIAGVSVCERPRLLDRGATLQERLGATAQAPPALAHLHQVDDPELVAALREHAPVAISAHGYTACTSGVHYFRPGRESARPHGPGCIPNLIVCAHLRNPTTLPRRYAAASRGLRALRSADVAISYSSAVDRHLAANAVEHRAIVPYFPTIPQASQPVPRVPRRVVFAGRVIAAKGVGVLIRAAARVQGEFYICGDGRQSEAMRRLARRLRVERRVHFTGWLAPQELGTKLASASVVAVPSVWPEPFGLVGIEGLAAATPAIASATGGVGDWLQDGVNGLTVAPADVSALARALDALLADPQRQRRMGDAGRELVAKRFSQQRHMEVLLQAYGAAQRRWQALRAEAAPETISPPPRAAIA